ncbi:hypothetical protein GW17_00014855 [Ensete ventricosum]|nr:hypothetical protein GW17_00014855 [Ensete ventricosum]
MQSNNSEEMSSNIVVSKVINDFILKTVADIPDTSDSGLSKNAMVGILVGAVAGAIAVSVAVTVLIMRRYRGYRAISRKRSCKYRSRSSILNGIARTGWSAYQSAVSTSLPSAKVRYQLGCGLAAAKEKEEEEEEKENLEIRCHSPSIILIRRRPSPPDDIDETLPPLLLVTSNEEKSPPRSLFLV